MKNNKNEPLKCEIIDGKLIISVGVNTITYAAKTSPATNKYDRICNPEGSWKKIENKDEFAKDVLYELLREEEDGTTLVHQLLDKAINNAIDNGSMSVKYKE